MVKYRFSIAFYKKGWLKTVSFTYNKQDCFDREKKFWLKVLEEKDDEATKLGDEINKIINTKPVEGV